jgi:hypothetical protein
MLMSACMNMCTFLAASRTDLLRSLYVYRLTPINCPATDCCACWELPSPPPPPVRNCLKGTVSRYFLLLVFFTNHFPPAPEYPNKDRFKFFQKFAEIFASQDAPPVSTTNFATSFTSVVGTGGKQFEQWSDCWQLKMNLKKKIYLYAISTTQRCPKEIRQIFLLEDFFHLPPCSVNDTVGEPWAANISPNFRKNSKRPLWYNQGLGETDPCRKPEVENLVVLSL